MQHDVVDLILQDHEEMRRLIHQVRGAPADRAGILTLLTTLVSAHERAEESQVYPAVRQEASGADTVEHSQQEHLLADRLMRDLAAHEPGSGEYDRIVTDLMDAITHHLDEEESDLLPRMRETMPAERLDSLGAAFLEARATHLGEQATDITKRELEQQAANLDLPVGDRTKSELAESLDKRAEK